MEAFVSAGRICERHAGNDSHIGGRALAEHKTAQRPVDDADPVDVTRAQHQIRFLGRFEENRDVVRVVREIAVHLENEFIAALQSPFESSNVSPAQPLFFGSMQNVNGRMLGGEVVGSFAGAVG